MCAQCGFRFCPWDLPLQASAGSREPLEFSEQLAPPSQVAWPQTRLPLAWSPLRTCISSFSPLGWEIGEGLSYSRLIRTLDQSGVFNSSQEVILLSECSANIPAPGIRIPFQTVLAIHHPPLEGLSLTALRQASTVMCFLFGIIMQNPTG